MSQRFLWFLPLAAALALTGCSSAGEPQPEPEQSQTQQQGGNLDAGQVETVVRNLLGDDPSLTVVGNETMQQQLQMAKGVGSASGITPEECAKQMEQYTVTDLTASVSASGSIPDESLGKVVEVYSITDEATRKKISDALTLDDISGCEKVSVEQSGEKVSTKRQILPLKVEADQALTMSTQIDVGAGQKLSSVAVQALKGNNFVIVTFHTGLAEPATMAAEAVELTNKAFAEMEGAN
ncbi:hypothetical protein [Glutamicibacter protophormiae]|uniref:DUF5642 domain-containing protein n=1 Tax=Glutamicibacter protophormiae TaxID=37930 RepID=A0ABS4XR17_GLUPR|nr:hypothetical protein [Glutamicibacter protophormiae]MBP2398961.1 hypothetical protein [Glutamicibacter protophormiae]GGL83799.1 hypothetical protein GCM10010038_12290 [Glutamicibacter protophormiae]